MDQNVHITVSPPRNSYLLEDLSPFTLYAVSVTAKATHGESGRSSPITIHTMEAGQWNWKSNCEMLWDAYFYVLYVCNWFVMLLWQRSIFLFHNLYHCSYRRESSFEIIDLTISTVCNAGLNCKFHVWNFIQKWKFPGIFNVLRTTYVQNNSNLAISCDVLLIRSSCSLM